MEDKTNILIVDDQPDNLVVLEAVLSLPTYNLVSAKSGGEALELLQKNNFAVILLDVRMPGMDGFETATVIKRQGQHQFVPIIFISANYVDSISVQRGYEVGGVEYLVKPFDPQALQAKVAFFVNLHRRNMKAEEQTQLERVLVEQERLKTLHQLETKSKMLEEALENLRAEKELREKFVATLAHDLRNPITAAKMSAELVERNPETLESNRKHLQRVITNIGRADQMIQDLLDANRLRAGEKLPTFISQWNMADILRDTLHDLTTIYGDRLRLSGPDEIQGLWCKNGIRRIIENLVSNGIKYGDPHKPVDITVEESGPNEVKIHVHNEGTPLSSEEQRNIFEPYKRCHATKPYSPQGWGLGLTLVRGVAEAHGGSVEVQSSKEKGTTFTVTLPRESHPKIK